MKKEHRIYVAGHRGLAGSAIVRALQAAGYQNLILRTHAELDLLDQAQVNWFFSIERPDHVFLAAAKVGGIAANNTYRADFIYQNLLIEANVIHAAWRFGTRKLLFLGSSCIYPKLAPQPMREDSLLTGLLEPTNEPYAIAKIAGIKLCGAFNAQYGTEFLSVMPTNLYGPGDNYDLETSHVLPALLRKAHEAKCEGAEELTVWGSGTPRREFLYSDDLGRACVLIMSQYGHKDIGEFINVGTGEEHSIAEIATTVAEVVGFRGRLVFDRTKPDGTPRKLMDETRLRALGWRPEVPFKEGIRRAYDDYLRRLSATVPHQR
jgi:GDP-L-fucose synthase